MTVPSQDLDFQRHMFSFVFYGLRWEVVVRFVDIDEIVDYHCLIFFIIALFFVCWYCISYLYLLYMLSMTSVIYTCCMCCLWHQLSILVACVVYDISYLYLLYVLSMTSVIHTCCMGCLWHQLSILVVWVVYDISYLCLLYVLSMTSVHGFGSSTLWFLKYDLEMTSSMGM
jgi:hypothetical protein